MTIIKNGVGVLFSNDEDLKKACNKLNMPIEFIPIADSNEKMLKEYRKTYFKPQYLKKGRRARR